MDVPTTAAEVALRKLEKATAAIATLRKAKAEYRRIMLDELGGIEKEYETGLVDGFDEWISIPGVPGNWEIGR